LVRLADPDHITELLQLLELSMDDATSTWHLGPDGWQRHHLAPDGSPLLDLQDYLISRQRRRPDQAL
jgi:polyphosphate kinase